MLLSCTTASALGGVNNLWVWEHFSRKYSVFTTIRGGEGPWRGCGAGGRATDTNVAKREVKGEYQ